MGDFNAKIGSGVLLEEEREVIGQFGLGARNERGNSLIDFCAGNSLRVANTMFSIIQDAFIHGRVLEARCVIKLTIFS